MTELRQRFIEDLQLQGKSKRTRDAYVRTVRMLAEHFNTPPDQLSEAQIRQYFLSVTNSDSCNMCCPKAFRKSGIAASCIPAPVRP